MCAFDSRYCGPIRVAERVERKVPNLVKLSRVPDVVEAHEPVYRMDLRRIGKSGLDDRGAENGAERGE